MPMNADWDTVGPMARTVGDLARVLDARHPCREDRVVLQERAIALVDESVHVLGQAVDPTDRSGADHVREVVPIDVQESAVLDVGEVVGAEDVARIHRVDDVELEVAGPRCHRLNGINSA